MVLGTYFVRHADMTRCEEDVRKLERHLQELQILYDLITDLITGRQTVHVEWKRHHPEMVQE